MIKSQEWEIELTIVGMRHRLKEDVRKMLQRSVPFSVSLEREPDNKVDRHAIKVLYADPDKLAKLKGNHLGYLRRGIASMLAPALDRKRVEATKLIVTDVDVISGQATVEATFSDVKNRSTKPKTRKSVKRV